MGKIVQKHGLLLNRIFPARGQERFIANGLYSIFVGRSLRGTQRGVASLHGGESCGPPDSVESDALRLLLAASTSVRCRRRSHKQGEWRPPRGGGVGRATRRVAKSSTRSNVGVEAARFGCRAVPGQLPGAETRAPSSVGASRWGAAGPSDLRSQRTARPNREVEAASKSHFAEVGRPKLGYRRPVRHPTGAA